MSADVVISEIQAINERTLQDEESDESDWIELHNNGATDVELGGWFLSDSADNLRRWEFPKLTIRAGRYLVIFASGKNQHEPPSIFSPTEITETHTDFKLSGDGEYLALVKPDGVTIASELIFPAQTVDTSYGLQDGNYVFFAVPTPADDNAGGVETLGPIIEYVTDSPERPSTSDTEIVIRAEVYPSVHPINSVTLHYRSGFNGEATKPMVDDGTLEDETAGDGVYTARLPLGSVFSGVIPGEMIRWRVTARDTEGNGSRKPLFPDPLDSPQYYGTAVLDPEVESSKLPVLHWWVQNPSGANSDSGARGSIFFNGRFYDNILTDVHGQSTRSFPKKSYDFDLNKGDRMVWKEGEPTLKDFNLLTNWADKTKVRNTLSYEVYARAGVPGHFAFPVRVQQNNKFFSVADFVEDGDDKYLERVGFDPEGALYKMYNNLSSVGDAEKKSRRWEAGTQDLQTLVSGLTGGSTVQRLDYFYDNVNIPNTVNYLAAGVVINNSDFGHKNYYVYRDSDRSGEWFLLPWDVDLSWGRLWNSTDTYFDDSLFTNLPLNQDHGNQLAAVFRSDPNLQKMFYRRVRTLLDEMMQEPGTPYEDRFVERRLDEMLALIDTDGVESDADLDYAKWGSWRNSNTMAQAVQRLKDEYMEQRRTYLYNQVGSGANQIPGPQIGSPMIAVEAVDFRPESGDELEEYIEIRNQAAKEVDISGWKLTGAVDYTFQPGTVILAGSIFSPGQGKLYVARDVKAFRNRSVSPKGGERLYVQGNYAGQLSARGETIQILDAQGSLVSEFTFAGDPSPAQQYLRITEIMYAPTASDGSSQFGDFDYEYVELRNIGGETLDLGGVAFTEGIAFTFPNGTELEPGAYILVANSLAAFTERYGADLNVAGEFDGRLDNNGENLRLVDNFGENILKFDYEGDWHPAASGEGHSLVIRDEQADFTAWDGKEQWAAGSAPQGAPGESDTIDGGTTGVETWLASHFSAAELEDGTISGLDADADSDGLKNLLEYILASNPRNDSSVNAPEPVVVESEGDSYLALRFNRLSSATSEFAIVVETSGDAETWNPTQETVGEPINNGDGTETVVYRDIVPMDGVGHRFIRLKVAEE